MRTKLFSSILIVSSLLFVNCKGENKEEKEAKPEQDRSFKVTMNMVVPKDDNFQIYFNEDGSDNYPAEQYVNVAVKGKPEMQDIVFKLPEDRLPASLRFDIGSNKEQGEIKILNFKMDYVGQHFEAKDTLFFHYFGNNTSIKYVRDKAIAIPLPNNPSGYDPIFSGTENLKAELKKLTR